MSRSSRELRADGEATRARILEAAGELFAAAGFAEVSNKAIASRAKVDLASINYHFGNRDDLYQSVLAEAHQRLVNLTELQQLADSDLSAQKKVQVLTRQIVDFSREEPQSWHLRILAREVLAPSSHMEAVLRDVSFPKVLLIKRLLGEITGIPEDDPALVRCLLSVGAPCLMLLVGERSQTSSWNGVFQMPAGAIAEHLSLFAMGGLEAVAHEYARRKKA